MQRYLLLENTNLSLFKVIQEPYKLKCLFVLLNVASNNYLALVLLKGQNQPLLQLTPLFRQNQLRYYLKIQNSHFLLTKAKIWQFYIVRSFMKAKKLTRFKISVNNFILVQIFNGKKNLSNNLGCFLIWEAFTTLFFLLNDLRELTTSHEFHSHKYPVANFSKLKL